MRTAYETAKLAEQYQTQLDKVLPNSGIRIGTQNGTDVVSAPMTEATIRRLLGPLSRDWKAENQW